jgi:hypothetical protein
VPRSVISARYLNPFSRPGSDFGSVQSIPSPLATGTVTSRHGSVWDRCQSAYFIRIGHPVFHEWPCSRNIGCMALPCESFGWIALRHGHKLPHKVVHQEVRMAQVESFSAAASEPVYELCLNREKRGPRCSTRRDPRNAPSEGEPPFEPAPDARQTRVCPAAGSSGADKENEAPPTEPFIIPSGSTCCSTWARRR